jgi:predicted RNase H-like HicB family nuclease
MKHTKLLTMDCTKIRKAATCTWSNDDNAWIITTPECIQLASHGATQAEAWALFDELLALYYQDFKVGKFKPAKRMGRPPVIRIRKTTTLDPSTIEKLAQLKHLYGFNDGQAIDWVVSHVALPTE